jgi:branched-chain amino acid transport system permease protein
MGAGLAVTCTSMKYSLSVKLLKKAPLGLAVLMLLAGPVCFPGADLYCLVFGLACFYASLAMAWNILALSGLVSLGHGAFFGLGAYAAILLEQNLHVPVYPAVLAGGFMGAFYGILWGLAFKKLRGAYFALASLASLEIPRVIVDNWDSLTSGSLGIVGIPRLPGLDLGFLHLPVGDSMQAQYYFLLLWMVLVGLIHYRAVSSRWGWALRAIRENEIAAGVLGVDVFGYRFLSLGLSAFLTGVCGGLYAHLMGLIEPGMVFSLQLAAFPLVLSFFGGRFSIMGPILGALVLYPLDQLVLQPLLPQGHAALYGLVIILTIFYFPQGLASWLWQRLRIS